MKVISSHRTSNGFKYATQNEENIIGPYISNLTFQPTYQEAVLIDKTITKLREHSVSNFDDDCWTESFCDKQPDRTECIGDLKVCAELNSFLSDKYNIVFVSDNIGEKCILDFEKVISPLVNCFKGVLNDAFDSYNKQQYTFYKRIEAIEKEQQNFENNKNTYIIKKCFPTFRNNVLNNRISPNEKVFALFEEYPLDIATICGDTDLYLYLIEKGAQNSKREINVDYALQEANMAALRNVLSLGGDLDWASTSTFEPIKIIGDINIKSVFTFFEKLPSEYSEVFFTPEPQPIVYEGIELSTRNLLLLQLVIYRRFCYDWDARKRDDIYYFDSHFHDLFMSGISKEFDSIEPTNTNCKTFRLFCQFYTRDSEFEVEANVDNSDRYESEIRFDSKLKYCIKFKDFKYIKKYYSKYSTKNFFILNFDRDFREKYLNQDYLGKDFYNYLKDIYEDESINMD